MEVSGHRNFMVALSPGKRPIVQKDRSALGLVWTKAESLASTRIRSLNRPVCSKSLYRIHYPSP